MRASSALLFLLIGCASDEAADAPMLPPPVPVLVDTDADTTAPVQQVGSRRLPFRPAWPAGDGKVWVPAAGRLLTPYGTEPIDAPTEKCNTGFLIETKQPAVGWLPEGAALQFPEAPAVQAATVERVAWRLAEVLGPPEGLVAGGRADADPALHEGLEVHSVRKVRRQGPPALIAVGQRGGRIALALLDRDATVAHAADVIELGDPPWATPALVPPSDLEGDGRYELVVWGDIRQDGARLPGFRAAYDLDLGPAMTLARIGLEMGQPIVCQPVEAPKQP